MGRKVIWAPRAVALLDEAASGFAQKVAKAIIKGSSRR
jgi:hypothetical protein